jgi:hypothetical protein
MDDLRIRDRVRLREDYLDVPCEAVGVVIGVYGGDEPAGAVKFAGGVSRVPLHLLEPLDDGD